MRPQTVSQVGVGQSDLIKLDWEQARFNVGLQLVQDLAGAAGAAVEYTLSDPDDAGSIVWETLQATQIAGNILPPLTTPCRAVRLDVTNGNYTLLVIQSS